MRRRTLLTALTALTLALTGCGASFDRSLHTEAVESARSEANAKVEDAASGITAGRQAWWRYHLDGCKQGQDNWKTTDPIKWYCSVKHVAVWPAARTVDDVTPALLELDGRLRDLGCTVKSERYTAERTLRTSNEDWLDPTRDANSDGRHNVADIGPARYVCDGAEVTVETFDLGSGPLAHDKAHMWERHFFDATIAWDKDDWSTHAAARNRIAADDSFMYWWVTVGIDDYVRVPR